jgi:hypothetical protein
MNTLEDKVRAALRETAGEITPRSVPPLRLHDGRRRGPLGAVIRHGWPGWLVPLAAAASVALVIAASLAVSGVLDARHPATARHQSGPFAGVPPYYLVLRGTNPSPTALQPQFALIKATATGAVVARITPPKPYGTFVAVTAAADRTYVLAASPWRVHHVDGGVDVPESPTKFFLLRLGPHGRPAHLTALPIAPLPGTAANIAVSPDGSQLAVAVRGGEAGGPSAAITVFNLATGSERVWTWPGGGPITNNAGGGGEVLSWTADGRTLAFQQWVGNSIDIRLLDTTTPGGSLRSDSRLAVRWKDDAETFHFVHGKAGNVIFGFSAIITGDGTKIVAATASETRHPLNSELAFTEFSASTGKVVEVLGRWPIPGLYPGQTQDVLWANSSGSTLIVLAHVPGPPAKDPHSINTAGYRIEFGVLHGNEFTPLPGAPAPGPGSWPAW